MHHNLQIDSPSRPDQLFKHPLNRICEPDEKDWSIVALALAFGCPIWTEDQDFFGTGIATWRTKNIEIFFNE
ncbi:MAG: hypothetical protein DSM106950_03025 [Stigonema ocellatum SAG 48.90 = DSM 106950]|nr:hypothetical protein [Stigonema ocellatum SAG 48.90 = DSM 106950]